MAAELLQSARTENFIYQIESNQCYLWQPKKPHWLLPFACVKSSWWHADCWLHEWGVKFLAQPTTHKQPEYRTFTAMKQCIWLKINNCCVFNVMHSCKNLTCRAQAFEIPLKDHLARTLCAYNLLEVSKCFRFHTTFPTSLCWQLAKRKQASGWSFKYWWTMATCEATFTNSL